MNFSVDLNCDMGEGMANDALIMPFISSANIACGAHAGDERHPRVLQDRRIHEHDVRHRDERGASRDDLGLPVCIQPRKLKIVLQRSFALSKQTKPPALG